MFSRDSIIRSSKYLLLIGLIACAYFIFGLLGLEFKVPPSNAGVLWPPAGISLAAVLLLGKRACPGIFIGNFCLSAWAFGFNQEAWLIIYTATGFGATACALVGSLLIQHHVGFPNPLTDDKSILLFMLLGGPLSCLLPATIGIIAMNITGVISLSEIPVNWICWWVGDTMGVLVFAPLMLIVFGKPQTIWHKRRNSVGLPLILTFALVVMFFFYVRKINEHQHQQQLKDQS
ncbi:MAG: MASE1 domain-containing protein, partial [Gammaproteobacteria bacterium]